MARGSIVSLPGFSAYRLSKPHAGAPAVLVDELDAGCPLYTLSSCSSGDPGRLHKWIGRDLPTYSDLLDHLEGQGPAPSQDFGRTRPRAQNVCKLRLTVTEFLDRIVQHIHRAKSPPALERPAPFLIRLDQRHENVELVTLRRPDGRAPKLLDLRKCGAVVFVSADRADLHGGPHQNLATVRASMASYSRCVPTNFTNAICRRKSNAAINR